MLNSYNKRATDDAFQWLTPEAALNDRTREIYPLRVSHTTGQPQYLALCRGSSAPDALLGFIAVTVNEKGRIPDSFYEELSSRPCYLTDDTSMNVYSVFTIEAGKVFFGTEMTLPLDPDNLINVGSAPMLLTENGLPQNTYLCNIPHSAQAASPSLFLEGVFQLNGTNTSTCFVPQIRPRINAQLFFSANSTPPNLYNALSPLTCPSPNSQQTTSIYCYRGTLYDAEKCQCLRSGSTALETVTTLTFLSTLIALINTAL